MFADVQAFLNGYYLPSILNLLSWAATGLGLLVVVAFVYKVITPYDEVALIRDNNTAAAVTFGGTLIGVALPIASVIIGSHRLVEVLMWGLVALLLQLATWKLVSMLFGNFKARIEGNQMAPAIFLAMADVAVGTIMAGCFQT